MKETKRTRYIPQSRNRKRTRRALHARRLLANNGYSTSSPIVMMIGDVHRTSNVLRCTYLETILGRMIISDHLRHIVLDDDEEHELAHFLVLICSFFWRMHGMFRRVYSLGSLKKITMHFLFLRQKDLSESLVYCQYHFVLQKYDPGARESSTCFQVLKAPY